uniref:Uncharacterized protein n=1 Tax=Anguilla anguilla TaxID=7936 RepID=A0A0E9XTM3_ANGAN
MCLNALKMNLYSVMILFDGKYVHAC